MNYQFKSTNKDLFSLHDCEATSAKLEDDKLTFYFPKGIFYCEYGDYWPNTAKAALEFEVEYLDEITFYLFKEKSKKRIVKEYTIEEVIEKINKKKWQIEFLYRYDGYNEVMYTVMVWFNKKPYSYEGQIFIRNKSETYYYDGRINDEDY